MRFPLPQVRPDQVVAGLDPGALEYPEDGRAAVLGPGRIPQGHLSLVRGSGPVHVRAGVVRLADHAPQFRAVDRVPGGERPAPVEDHRVHRHRTMIPILTAPSIGADQAGPSVVGRSTAKMTIAWGCPLKPGLRGQDRRPACRHEPHEDWLRRHIPVASSLVPSFSVTCRTSAQSGGRSGIAGHRHTRRIGCTNWNTSAGWRMRSGRTPGAYLRGACPPGLLRPRAPPWPVRWPWLAAWRPGPHAPPRRLRPVPLRPPVTQ